MMHNIESSVAHLTELSLHEVGAVQAVETINSDDTFLLTKFLLKNHHIARLTP
jgi:hypothetical protein